MLYWAGTIARMDARDALARTSVTIEVESQIPCGRYALKGGGRIIVMSSVEALNLGGVCV